MSLYHPLTAAPPLAVTAPGEVIAYPTVPPVSEIQYFANMLLGRQPKNHQLAAKCAYVIVGYGLGVTLGEPNSPMTKAAAASEPIEPLTPAEVVSSLQVLAGALSAPKAMGGLGSAVVARLLRAVMPYLIEWLKDFLLSEDGLGRLIENISNRS